MRSIQHTASINRRLSPCRGTGQALGRSAPLALSPGQMRPQPLPNLIGHIVAPVRYRHTPTSHTLPISSNLPPYRHFDDTP